MKTQTRWMLVTIAALAATTSVAHARVTDMGNGGDGLELASPSQGIESECSEVSQFSAPVGTPCLTSVGVKFIRVPGGWEDIGENGKTWYDRVTDNVSPEGAHRFCDSIATRILPSAQDFVTAEKHGFREVLKDMQGEWFWSFGVDTGLTCSCDLFDGDDGRFDFNPSNLFVGDGNTMTTAAARCVGR